MLTMIIPDAMRRQRLWLILLIAQDQGRRSNAKPIEAIKVDGSWP